MSNTPKETVDPERYGTLTVRAAKPAFNPTINTTKSKASLETNDKTKFETPEVDRAITLNVDPRITALFYYHIEDPASLNDQPSPLHTHLRGDANTAKGIHELETTTVILNIRFLPPPPSLGRLFSVKSYELAEEFARHIYSVLTTQRVAGTIPTNLPKHFPVNGKIAHCLDNLVREDLGYVIVIVPSWIQSQYKYYGERKNFFKIDFAKDDQDYITRSPEIPREGIKPELDLDIYQRTVESRWRDLRIGDWTAIQQPSDGVHYLIPIISSSIA